MKKLLVAAALVSGSVFLLPGVSSAAVADGRCVAKGAGFTFDGPTKAAVARGDLGVSMRTVILDHAFNGADTTESFLGLSTPICD